MNLFKYSCLKPLLDTMNGFSTTKHGVTRIAYSYEEYKAKQLFIDTCTNLGMSVKSR